MPRTLLVSLAALSLAACKSSSEVPAGVISTDRFVDANVAVRLLPDSAPQAEREAALRKVGVTDRQLRAWVTAYARRPETLADTWERIAFQVDSIAGTRPVPGEPAPPGAEVSADAVPPAAGPAPLPVNEDSVLRRDDSLRFRRPRPRPDPAQRMDEVRSKRGMAVQQ